MPATFTPLINNLEPLCEYLYVYGLFENTDIQTKFKKRRIFTNVVGE